MTFPMFICQNRLHRSRLLVLLLLGFGLAGTALAQTSASSRLKEMVMIEGMAPVQLTGYGLVVGLDRTGDRVRGQRGAPYTVFSIANMLKRFGITVDPDLLTSRNVAAVMVTATMSPFGGPGTPLDVTVSALGDARSLSGGVLLQTPMLNPMTNEMHAMAQGPLATGAILAATRGANVRVNHTNTGRVPNGGVVTKSLEVTLNQEQLDLVLKHPDFTNAVHVAEAINQTFPGAAEVTHAGLVQVTVPGNAGGAAGLMAALEGLTVEVDLPAQVVINERTGTIVSGGNIRISEVMITYGSLMVSTQNDPVISQPAPFSQGGQTVTETRGSAQVEEERARSVVLPPNTDVAQLAAALNELGLTSRDVISIFQAIDRAGALQGELVIL